MTTTSALRQKALIGNVAKRPPRKSIKSTPQSKSRRHWGKSYVHKVRNRPIFPIHLVGRYFEMTGIQKLQIKYREGKPSEDEQ